MAHSPSGKQASGQTTQASEDMQECIDECLTCYQVCLETIRHCLSKGGAHAAPEHIRVLEDCAKACETSANFMMRGSKMHGSTCGVCAEACGRCAVACERFPDDAQMKACAEACRECAASCNEMAGA